MSSTIVTPQRDLSIILGTIVVATVLLCFLSASNFNGLDEDEPMYMVPLNRMYFVMSTLSTVGYGDISPRSPLAKSASILMMLSMFSFIAL